MELYLFLEGLNMGNPGHGIFRLLDEELVPAIGSI
jgi:hypothetical protein